MLLLLLVSLLPSEGLGLSSGFGGLLLLLCLLLLLVPAGGAGRLQHIGTAMSIQREQLQ